MNRFEDRLQAQIVEYMRLVAPMCQTFAVPNGGLRSKSEAARLKWTGVLAGVPDLVCIVPGGRAHCIEVKAPGGSLSPGQKDFRDWCLANEVPHVVAKGIDDVRSALADWGVKTREHASA